jgi:glycosyltransferase involved in cell wall biosynthesis
VTLATSVEIPRPTTGQLQVLLVNATLGAEGGVTVDVENIARGLNHHGGLALVCNSTRAVTRDLRGRRGDIVHVFGCLPTPSEWTAFVAAKAFGHILVWTPVFSPLRPSSWRERKHDWRMAVPFRAMRAFDRVMPKTARFADAVIAATEAEAIFFSKIGAARVELIPPGVATVGQRGNQDLTFRRRFGLRGGPVVLLVGRDSSPKALDVGVASFERLRATHPEAQLLLVGPPAGHAYASMEGISCPGWIAPDEIELALAHSTVLFVPSVYEGLPRAVVEAWSFGLPIVASDRVPLSPDIQGITGRTVPYGDAGAAAAALHEVIADPVQADRWGRVGRQLVEERYLLDRVVTETIALYEDLRGGAARA